MRSAPEFYHTKDWKKAREAYIKERVAIDGGLCEMCHASVGYIVHHKIHLNRGNKHNSDITLNQNNLQFLCLECHNSIHYTKKTCKFNENGQPIDIRAL